MKKTSIHIATLLDLKELRFGVVLANYIESFCCLWKFTLKKSPYTKEKLHLELAS